MDKQRRKELQQQVKQMKTYMGVVKITNTENRKVYITSYPDLRNQWQTVQSWLNDGNGASLSLVKDWKTYGSEAFTYEVLEQVARGSESPQDVRWKLRQMEKSWLERLAPYGDAGYNHPPRW